MEPCFKSTRLPDEIEKDLSFSISVSYFVEHTQTQGSRIGGKSYGLLENCLWKVEATYALYFSPDVSRGWSNDRFFFSPPFFFLFFFYYQSIAHRNIRYRDRFAFWFKNNLFSSECGTYIARASKRQARYLVKIYFLVFIANNTTSVFFFFLPFFYKRYLHNYISVSVPR